MKKNIYFDILLLLFVFIINNNIYSQEWFNYIDITSSSDVKIYDSDIDENNNIFIAGHYKGSIGDSIPSAGLFDFFIGKFDIDLNPLWIKNIGSEKVEFFGIRTIIDGSNNLYVSGQFQDTCYFNGDRDSLISEGSYDIFLAKYDNGGQFLWSKNIAKAPSLQWLTDLDIDQDNNILMTGYFTDSVIVQNDTIRASGAYNSYILKLNSVGDTIWKKTVLTSSNSGYVSNIKAFNDGYYVNGYFSGDLFLNLKTLSSYDAGKKDVYLFKLNFDGDELWVRQCYGNNNDFATSIAQDEYGNTYYTGYYSGTIFYADSTESITSNVVLSTIGADDIFICKYNKNGNLTWLNSYGGPNNDAGKEIQVKNNKLYLTGYFTDSIQFVDEKLYSSPSLDKDIFIAIFDDFGNGIQQSSLIGAGGEDNGDVFEITSNGIVTIGGYFKSPNLIIGSNSLINSTGTFNGVLAQFIPKLSATFTKNTNPTCNGGSNGELVVTPYFGVSPYTYSWSHNGTLNDSTATGLSAGLYSVTVTDALDSTDVAQYTLTEPGAFIFNPVITQVTTCSYSSEGAINLNLTGGNGGNTYQWFESEGGNGVILTNEDQTNLAIGRYDVTVTDSKSCTGDTVIYITGPGPVIFGSSIVTDDSGVDPIHNGAIDLILTGGTGADPDLYGASWTGPAGYTASVQDISSLAGGNYSVTITDNNSCLFDSMFTVIDLDTLFAYISDKKDDCTGGAGDGTATVSYNTPNGSAVISYLWSNGGTTATITGLVPGTYKVTVTDSNLSETSEDSVEIFDLGYTMAGNLSGTTSVDCKGDADGYIDLTITTPGQLPYTYNWSNSATTQDIIDLTIGTYHVTVTDDNACTLQISNYSITEPEFDLTASASIVTEPLCNGDLNGKIRVDAAGGNGVYSYQWNDPGSQTTQIADGLDAGFYIVTVIDYKGCTTTDNVNLTQPGLLTVSGSIGDLTCFNNNSGTIALTVGGGTPTYSYYWTTSDGSGLVAVDKNQSGLSVGTYEVTVTDGNLCEIDDAFIVTEPPVLEITNEEKTDITTCNGDNTGIITITATGGTGVLTYILNPGAIQTNNTGAFTGISAGTYTVDVDDENGCGQLTSSSIEITEPTQISITAETPTDISCFGLTDGQIVIAASGGTGTLEYSIDNGTIYQASGTFSGLAQGTNYQVKIQDANLCEVTGSTLTITEPTELAIDSTVIDITCNGSTDGSIDITASGGTITTVYTYNWSTTDGSGLVADSEDQTGLGAGTYDLTVTDDNLCTVTASISISEPAVINLESSDAINPACNGSTDGSIDITISGGTIATNYTYSWATTDGSGLVADAEDQTGLSAGTYDLTVTDDNSCASVFEIVLDDPLEISIDSENSTDASSQTTADGTITVVASGGTGTLTYDLNPGDDSNITGIFNSLLSGDYTVDVTDENSCGHVSSSTITVGFANAIDDLVISDKIKVYPNPTSAKLNIEIDFEIDDVYKIEILTISGQVLFNKEIKSHGITKEELDLSNYPKGIYFIRIYNNQFNFKEKILLQ